MSYYDVCGVGGEGQTHVVIGERVSPCRIVHLSNLPYQVIDVIHFRRVRILLRREAVQFVVDVVDRLAFPVGLAGQVAIRVVGIRLTERRWEIRIRYAAKGVIGERSRVAVRILDAGEVVLGVIPIVGDVARRIGDASQPVGGVIRVCGGLAILVGRRCPPSA